MTLPLIPHQPAQEYDQHNADPFADHELPPIRRKRIMPRSATKLVDANMKARLGISAAPF
jgi:hypothetical protein